MTDIAHLGSRNLAAERSKTADAACEQVKAQLAEAIGLLDDLTDATFLLVHLVMKGYRTDDQVTVTRFFLEDAMAFLKEHGTAPNGCEKCGSRNPEDSIWHANHCIKETP